jgi:hypothetical protein
VATTIEPRTDDSATAGREVEKIVLPGQTPEGQYILAVLVKRSYKVVAGQQCQRAECDRRIIPGDVHYGDPMNSSVKFEADFVPFKVATDVVFNGSAFAPSGAPATAVTASIVVGQTRKDILVLGDRTCRHRLLGDPVFSDPEPFTSIAIEYGRAYGGTDVFSDPSVPCVYPRNPLGRGFVVGKSKRAIDNLPLPNIEDPQDRLTAERLSIGKPLDWPRQPMPQGFGWFGKAWQPRAALGGVLPADRPVAEELRRVYAQAVPAAQRDAYEQTRLPDMDFRFFSGASQGLALPFLDGTEEVRLVNLAPEGEVKFRLPGDRPRIGLDIGNGVEEPAVVLHTVMLRMEDRELDLVWRGAVPYPGPDWLPQMRKMEVLIQ